MTRNIKTNMSQNDSQIQNYESLGLLNQNKNESK